MLRDPTLLRNLTNYQTEGRLTPRRPSLCISFKPWGVPLAAQVIRGKYVLAAGKFCWN